jgi:uncharacterized membrane protein YraQ (UPF0718 family)
MTFIGLIYLVIIIIAYLLLGRSSTEKTRKSLKISVESFVKMTPLLLAIFALIGLFEEFVSPAWIESRFGADAGLMALLTGAGLGSIAIGPPLAAFPLAGTLLDNGAWPSAVATFIVAWISVGIVTLPFEIEVFGLRFTLLRNSLAFASALLIGLCIGVII